MATHCVKEKWTIFSFTRSVLKFRKIVDVAHFHFPPTEPSFAFYFAPLILKFLGVRVYQTWHEELSRRGVVIALMLRLASSSIFVVKKDFVERSSKLSRWCLKFFEIIVIPSAPLQHVKPDVSKSISDLIEPLAVARYNAIFVVIGFLFAKRNVEAILDCMDASSELLVLAGDHSVDAGYHSFLKSKIEKRGLQENVKFLGFVEDGELSRLAAAATAIVFTNRGGVFEWNTSFQLSCFCLCRLSIFLILQKENLLSPGLLGQAAISDCLTGTIDRFEKKWTGHMG